jgi:hypothetical protein
MQGSSGSKGKKAQLGKQMKSACSTALLVVDSFGADGAAMIRTQAGKIMNIFLEVPRMQQSTTLGTVTATSARFPDLLVYCIIPPHITRRASVLLCCCAAALHSIGRGAGIILDGAIIVALL